MDILSTQQLSLDGEVTAVWNQEVCRRQDACAKCANLFLTWKTANEVQVHLASAKVDDTETADNGQYAERTHT